jgi:glycosyltransferase involved in cell wall biosynthesis
MNHSYKPFVAVCIVSYNHELYLSKAIESALMQKTDFPYKVYIGDDCSTDNTADICTFYKNKYPDKVEILKTEINIGLVGNTQRVLEKIKQDGAKYVAMLDGDDYWIKDDKIQKQVNFLEDNEEYGLVCSSISILSNKGLRKLDFNPIDGHLSLQYSDLIFPIANNSVMFKIELLDLVDMDDFIRRGFVSCDYAMYMTFSNYTKFKSFDDNVAVWRRGHDSVSNPNSIEKRVKYINNDIAQFKYLAERFPEKFSFTVEDEKLHRDLFMFKIYFGKKGFQNVNDILKNNPALKKIKKSKRDQLKMLIASHKWLYKLYRLLN